MQQSPLMAVEQNLEAVHLAIPDLPHDLLVLHHCLLFKREYRPDRKWLRK
jgi:hypothetical protein